jgi:hypothetical protein
MSDKDTARTSPSAETRAAEEEEARAAHEADRPPTAEEEKAAPAAVDSGAKESFEEMTRLGAEVKGEGEVP